MAIINVDDAYILNETGAQVDKTTGIPFKNESLTEAEAAQARANIRAGGSNRNLLDNAYFVGGGSQLGDGVFPINQRGQSSYTGGGTQLDRWKTWEANDVITLTANGVKFKSPNGNGMFQYWSEFPTTKTVTFSAIIDGNIYSVTLPEGDTQYEYIGTGFKIGISRNGKCVYMNSQNTEILIAACKLEVGTVSTLANDPPPDFGEELRKCQRYLWVATCEANDIMASGVTFGTNAIFDLITPVQIRGTQANVAIGVTPYIAVDNTVVLCGGSSAQGNIKGNHIRFQIGATADLGTYKNCNLLIPSVTFLQVANEL